MDEDFYERISYEIDMFQGLDDFDMDSVLPSDATHNEF